MTTPCHVTMEKTPSYFVTPDVASRVHNMSRDVRLIVVVRDPVIRAISDYAQVASKRLNFSSFESLALVRRTGHRATAKGNSTAKGVSSDLVVASSWSPIRIGLYAKHLLPWLKYFPRKQIHFVNGERLVDRPADEVRRVEEFLGLRPFVDEQHFYFNATKGFPCLQRQRDDVINSGVNSTKWRSTAVPDTVSASGEDVIKTESFLFTGCLGKDKGRTHPNVSEKVLRRLREFYRPYNKIFYRMTGIDFGWP